MTISKSFRPTPFRLGALLMAGCGLAGALAGRSRAHGSRSRAVTRERLAAAQRSLPLEFEPNRGQADRQVRFLARGDGYGLYLTRSQAVLALRRPGSAAPADGAHSGRRRGEKDAWSVLRMELLGANEEARTSGLEPLPGTSNYFRGNDPKKWLTDVPNYGRVRYAGVYPGVDLVYYGNQGQLEYDFQLQPGAAPEQIRLGFSGAERVEVDAQGQLAVRMPGGVVQHKQPVVYQEAAGRRQAVAGRYVQLARNEVGFALGRYDRSRPLVIDPVLEVLDLPGRLPPGRHHRRRRGR